jgi:hypothetical protein
MIQIQIGFWVESESRKVDRLTRYAADRIEIETKAGEYPLLLSFETGYLIPMPYWLRTSISGEVVGGGYFSGCAGNNFGFTPAEKGPTQHRLNMYEYTIDELIKSGKVRLSERFAKVLKNHGSFMAWVEAEHVTWDDLKKIPWQEGG